MVASIAAAAFVWQPPAGCKSGREQAMQLERGITLYAPEREASRRLALSQGTVKIADLNGRSAFETDAILASEPWQEVTPELYQCYFAPTATPAPGSWISIIKIP